jgi:acyl transferase domain-containing protein
MARPQVRVAAAMPTGQVSGEDEDPSAELDPVFERVDISPPSISLLSQVTGQVLDFGQVSSGAYWREQARTRASRESRAPSFTDLGVNLVLDMDPRRTAAPAELSSWPAAGPPAGHTFVEAVAAAYEAGLPVSFAGLFAGETRRRISLPGYPFQRERYWIETAS